MKKKSISRTEKQTGSEKRKEETDSKEENKIKFGRLECN